MRVTAYLLRQVENRGGMSAMRAILHLMRRTGDRGNTCTFKICSRHGWQSNERTVDLIL
jgi:hypothetical protein